MSERLVIVWWPGRHLQDRGKRTSSPIHPRDHGLQQRDHCCRDQGDRKEDACKRMLRKPVVNLPSEKFFYSLRSGLSPVAGMQGMTMVRKTTIVTIVVIPIVTFGMITSGWQGLTLMYGIPNPHMFGIPYPRMVYQTPIPKDRTNATSRCWWPGIALGMM